MKAMAHTFSLLAIGLRAALGRPGAASIVVLGVAAATIVLCVLTTAVASIQSAIMTAGREDRALVTRKGSTSELESAIPPRVREIAVSLPEVARNAEGTPHVSEEFVRVLDIRNGGEQPLSSFPIRGVSGDPSIVRPEIRIVAGRMFEPGRHELVLGQAVAAAIKSHRVGSSIDMNNVQWQVVGVFSAAGNSFESEILTDARTLQSFYEAQAMSSLTVQLRDPAAFASFKSTLESTPDIAVQVERESDYYSALSRRTGAPLQVVALLVGGLMSVAGVFLAMTASHAAFSARATEIATVRALGFEGRVVATSVLLEVGVLAVIGAVLGAVLAWILCKDTTVSLLTGDMRISQTAFRLRLGVENVALAAVAALGIGLLGGLPAAVKSVRRPLAEALRV
jgi:putative ABC transport system permease protein